jgi:CMP-N-acetylneuraminic acid synthetase
MKFIAYIFARGGSKGLPGKNILLFGGKPLIAHSIECAFSVKRIDRVIVSTDSEDIAEVARKYGAEVPFIRPKELAKDNSPEWLAWRHAINFMSKTLESNSKVMVSLPTTSPLRSKIDIENCLDEYEKGEADIVVTVTDAHRSPYFNMVSRKKDGTVELVNSLKESIFNRQDSPVVYDMTTVCYVANTDFIMNNNSTFEGRVKSVHVPVERAIDIDTLLDFQIAESLLKLRENQL